MTNDLEFHNFLVGKGRSLLEIENKIKKFVWLGSLSKLLDSDFKYDTLKLRVKDAEKDKILNWEEARIVIKLKELVEENSYRLKFIKRVAALII